MKVLPQTVHSSSKDGGLLKFCDPPNSGRNRRLGGRERWERNSLRGPQSPSKERGQLDRGAILGSLFPEKHANKKNFGDRIGAVSQTKRREAWFVAGWVVGETRGQGGE